MNSSQQACAESPFRYGGRTFTPDEVESIRQITDDPFHTTRADIARAVCDALGWVQHDGRPKLLTCKLALQRMEADGVIWLPLPTSEPPGYRAPTFTAATDPQEPIAGSRSDLHDLVLNPVLTRTDDARLWNELMARYHYLGGRPMAGAQIRYLAYDGARLLGAMGFGAAALRLAPRDRFIGWTDAERTANLHLVIEQRRFLILPWVSVRGLASSLLSLACRRLPADVQARYGYRPVLLETFTDRDRFRGTSYAAANWVRVGKSQGLGRLAATGAPRRSIKDIWLYPLDPQFRAVLSFGRLAPGDPRKALHGHAARETTR
jgi:hypothetical protein